MRTKKSRLLDLPDKLFSRKSSWSQEVEKNGIVVEYTLKWRIIIVSECAVCLCVYQLKRAIELW